MNTFASVSAEVALEQCSVSAELCLIKDVEDSLKTSCDVFQKWSDQEYDMLTSTAFSLFSAAFLKKTAGQTS